MASTPGRATCEARSVAVLPQMLSAVEHIRRMHGGTQSHLMRCSDGHYYVVKFPNNPQGARVLANELLGARLAAMLGLPVAAGKVVLVREELIRCTEELVFEMPRQSIPCQGGACFGSCYPVDPRCATAYNFLPDELLRNVKNIEDFWGMLVFDLWTCNTDSRQIVFFRNDGRSGYRALMIDQGACFNANEWNFPDSPLRGRYWRGIVYENVQGIDAFEPWINRIESPIIEHAILNYAEEIPPEWYESNRSSLDRLLNGLICRRGRVRELLWAVRKSVPQPFPNWTKRDSIEVRGMGQGLEKKNRGASAEPFSEPCA